MRPTPPKYPPIEWILTGVPLKGKSSSRTPVRFHVNSPRKRWCGMSYTYPLHVAVEQNDVEIVSLLLDCGADPEARDSWGRTPRQRAESAGAAVRRSFAAHKTRRKVLFGL
ncbi:unnamed protein product [Effrenium voratum]|nr:unnamed protein product [Effrenium voratum]